MWTVPSAAQTGGRQATARRHRCALADLSGTRAPARQAMYSDAPRTHKCIGTLRAGTAISVWGRTSASSLPHRAEPSVCVHSPRPPPSALCLSLCLSVSLRALYTPPHTQAGAALGLDPPRRLGEVVRQVLVLAKRHEALHRLDPFARLFIVQHVCGEAGPHASVTQQRQERRGRLCLFPNLRPYK
jgi:hypothetical protein